MGKFFAPFTTFVMGMFLVLMSLVMFPALGTAVADTKVATSNISGNYWGLVWAFDSARLWVFGIGLGFVLFSVAQKWLSHKSKWF